MQRVLELMLKLTKSIAITAGFLAACATIYAVIYPGDARRNLDAIVTAMERSADATEQVAENATEIAVNTKGSKREVSEDPVIQIVNRGYNFTPTHFITALSNRDIETVRLFCQSAPSGWIEDFRFYYINWSDELLAVMSNCPAVQKEVLCQLDPESHRIFGIRDSKAVLLLSDEEVESFQLFCGESSKSRMQDILVQLQREEDRKDMRRCEGVLERAKETVDRHRGSDLETILHYAGNVLSSIEYYPDSCNTILTDNCMRWLESRDPKRLPRTQHCLALGLDLRAELIAYARR